MSALSYKKNDDIESGALDKMTVYQECQRAFAESPINARKCRKLLAKLIHLLTIGETFSEFEATGLFIAVSKLFPHKDPSLRQIVYLAIKELVPLSNNDVIMVTSSITRDVQGSSDLIYKPNAIRALARVIDGSFVQGIERLMKTAIVDRHTSVSSAALVSAYHLLPIAKDTIRRWAAEVQEAVTSQKNFPAVTLPNYAPGPAVLAPYHALSLLYELRAHDRMALIKLIQQFSGASAHLQSPNANVMLIRFIAKAANDGAHRQQLVALLERYLGHKSDMVALEAAKAVLTLRDVSPKEAASAIESLRAFLASPRTIARFAAIRILNRFAMTNPGAVAVCNAEIQPLITDSNRSIATYAITALLKTGNEASVDKLVTQISGFMSDITDEFRIVVIDAVRSLALKFHAKKSTMLQFFGNTLRNDGGSAQYKAAVVAALFDMIRYVPDCRDTALGILCEFIEDCEYTEIVVSVLHTLGQEGPAAANPTVYIRYIYNRIVLENAFIRAAAVSALAKFALVDDTSVKKSVKVLLERSLEDETDEVRDRAVIALKLLESGDQAQAKAYISPESRFSLPILEHKLALYVTGSGADFDTPFDMSSVPLITDQEAREAALKAHRETTEATPVVNGGAGGPTPASAAAATTANLASKSNSHEAAIQRAEKYAAELAAIPDLAAFGTPLKSSLAVALTESETEFVVTAIKHIFPSHVVLQYDVHNTLPDAQLSNVSVVASIEDDSEELVEEFILPVDELGPDSHGTVYVALEKTEDHLAVASFENILKFTLHDINKTTGEVSEDGDEDEYQIENLVLGAGDYLEGGFIGSFDHLWDELANTEAVDTATLSEYKGLEEAVQFLISQLSLTPLESSDEVTSASTHTLKLFGKTLTGEKVIVQIKMAASQRTGVVVQCKARSGDEEVAELVAGFVGSL
ncbi:YALI0F03454p [Yarrowia lipolytica CLIB122]|jgi:coatomer protein complex subunit gamma|uniref:Coatomer subunit gamma n=1 Tax=Yarrowia lipolytica (strain CLIB 122 / E 150) TaxID=284591 RepID=Q6C314_YARLI|nr:YALI0F03454p [Yarrowia lipolytica CLIB122]KAB8280616.1 adaptin N terminal region-domain-containing protein [Yarrowia lipolytica]KAE8169751.1 adaptin N terminal region-domain-containing protein [Yarrowia lipolytica]KAJ8056169.1 adaptin N terminal region-domain-containing protein [Yarrowia lipolytica]QNQ01382.1 Coatomer subunit gamma [Yarrowia lipolytica]RMI97541.1 adaptin N terminal region-domain-containing protein [Yarrowia lipolytica]|eukprot:XP_504948.1 YALI0F03454p [Yarrowia lipolytica CLIB122]